MPERLVELFVNTDGNGYTLSVKDENEAHDFGLSILGSSTMHTDLPKVLRALNVVVIRVGSNVSKYLIEDLRDLGYKLEIY
jgi:hypothetical protein